MGTDPLTLARLDIARLYLALSRCGHCKTLAPVWRELATKFKDEDSVTIAKIDATANDLPASLPAKGYPSIFWVPAGTKTPVKYSGGRDMKVKV